VDDEKEVSNALAMTLQFAKLFKSEIELANDINTALSKLNNQEFDLVMADYMMPGMNGVELLKKVKEMNPNIVRVLITGYSDGNIAKDAINNAEVHHYIEKPWENKNLRATVYEALKKKESGEIKDIKSTKQKMKNWLMDIYNDAKNMGLDLTIVEYYIQNASNAIDSNDLGSALTHINQSINTMINIAEKSYPELSIEKQENIQLQADRWNKLNLKIINTGYINANDIDILFKGEFEIKSLKAIPTIKVNETKVITIDIYPKKSGIFPLEIQLLCKKMFDNTKHRFEESLWVQIGDMAGKTKLKRQFSYDKGYIKMELNIINEDLRDIKNVNLELHYDENTLVLSHIKPIYKKLNKNFNIGDIKSRDGKNIVIYFDPLSCTDTFISGGVSFKDWQDNDKYIMLEPQKIRVMSPQLFARDTISISELKRILEEELTFSGSKIINIPLGLNIKDTFMTCRELIFKFNTKIIHKIIKSNPDIIEAWFYSESLDAKCKFAIKIRIEEGTNSIELFIASSNNAALTGLLTDLLYHLNKDLQSKGIIMKPLKQIENIALKENIFSSKKSLLYEEMENLNLEKDLAKDIVNRSEALYEKFERIARKEQLYLTKRRSRVPEIQSYGSRSIR